MATIKDLQKYLNYEFSSGSYTGDDYKTFQTKYINYIKSVCKENNMEFVRANRNHYEFSAFIKCDGNYAYLSISDVRFFRNEWYSQILVRYAECEKDYIGGRNYYTSLPNLADMIKFVSV